MKKTTQNGLSSRFGITFAIIVLISFFLISYSNGQVRNEQDLISKTSDALEKTRFYRFEMHSDLLMMNENFQIIKAEGQVDVFNNNMYQLTTFQNRTVEVVVINDQVYYRENNGIWQIEKMENAEQLNEILGANGIYGN
jgi:hypothetical protein